MAPAATGPRSCRFEWPPPHRGPPRFDSPIILRRHFLTYPPDAVDCAASLASRASGGERNPIPFPCIVLRVKAVERTLSVLEALGRPRPLADIAERTGLPKPTVHRILQVLVARGFARDADDGVYAAGPRVLTVAGEALAELDLAGLARPALTALQRSVGGTVHLALRN